jgi:hypothetical protein
MDILGINLNGRTPDQIIEIVDIDAKSSKASFDKALKDAQVEFGKNNLVIFINAKKAMGNSTKFNLFKRLAEQKYGYHSISFTHAAFAKSQSKSKQLNFW